jgi:FkbM family methyltransferase
MNYQRLVRMFTKMRRKWTLSRRVLMSYDEDHRRRGIEVSFSQSGEDILSLYALRRLGIEVPSYVDIGANHPVKFSNTYLMYLLGGRGINIEPDPEAAGAIRRARSRDVTINAGVAADEGEKEFFIMSTNVANTFIRSEAEELERRDGNRIRRVVRVPIRNVRNLLAEYSFVPDFMSLDVEGMDLEILQSMDWDQCRPKVICVETIDYFTQQKRPEILRFLEERDYVLHADTFINSIFKDAKLPHGG